MKKFWIVFAVVAVLVGGGFGTLWYMMSRLERSVSVDGGVLVWHVSGAFPEELDDSFWGQVQGGDQLTLGESVLALDRAARDDRVTALVLDLQGVKADWAKVGELADAVGRFRASGKPVVAYLDGAGTRDYVLAAQAGQVVMSPEANLMILGVSAQLEFWKDILGKLGMKADFIHIGQYKSAPERMTRREASDPNREMVTSIVEDRWDDLLGQLAAARGRDRDQVAAWIDQGLFDATSALESGVVDTLGYWQDLMDDRYGDDDVTDFADYCLDRPKGRPRRRHGRPGLRDRRHHAGREPLRPLPGQDRRQRVGGRRPGRHGRRRRRGRGDPAGGQPRRQRPGQRPDLEGDPAPAGQEAGDRLHERHGGQRRLLRLLPGRLGLRRSGHPDRVDRRLRRQDGPHRHVREDRREPRVHHPRRQRPALQRRRRLHRRPARPVHQPRWSGSTTVSWARWPRAATWTRTRCAPWPRAGSGPGARPSGTAWWTGWAACSAPSRRPSGPWAWPRTTASA